MVSAARPRQTEQMEVGRRRIADAATIRVATGEDLDNLVQQIWDVAAEARWIGTEVPFDRGVRRFRLDALLSEASSTLLVADTSTAGGPGVVGHISITIAPYGVADIGMLLIAGWRGVGLGRRLLDASIEWSNSAGAHKMALEVWPHNSSALELYRRAGFVEEGRKRRHYRRKDGEIWDAVLMGRSLP
jgi:ribosomal protein S18 acetylase RimI-like enzyme